MSLWAAVLTERLSPWLLLPWLALSQCWTANTVSHIQLHRPLFRAASLNRCFDVYLSLLMGLPQSLWRARHLWHHAGEPAAGPKPVPRGRLWPELAALAALAAGLAASGRPDLWLAAAAGWLLGLVLCALQGWAEHHGAGLAAPEGLSCYAPWYNRLWFNDGYHREHHRWPGRHWRRLPEERLDPEAASPWPPLLRPLVGLLDLWQAGLCRLLDQLEALVLTRPGLQAWLLGCHGRAFDRVLARAEGRPATLRSALVVGGGLFPRSALVLRSRFPTLSLTLLDAEAEHLAAAQAWFHRRSPGDETIRFLEGRYGAKAEGALWQHAGEERFDLVIFPLAFRGDREHVYRSPPAALTLIHDWAWRRRGDAGCLVSPCLLKRLNLVQRRPADPGSAPSLPPAATRGGAQP